MRDPILRRLPHVLHPFLILLLVLLGACKPSQTALCAGTGFGIALRILSESGENLDTISTVTVVQLDPPGVGGVWLMSVHVKQAKGKTVPIDEALRAPDGGRGALAEWTRLGRIFPALGRAGVKARGQLALSQDEAWDFLTMVGPTLATTGFDVRAPLISRRKATPSLRLFAEERSEERRVGKECA